MLKFLGVIYLIQLCIGETAVLRGPPQVEKNPKFSSSYIPGAMQIIAHDTELMKYVIKPPKGSVTTTTTTLRPTPSHKPGIFAPSEPLGPARLAIPNPYGEYVKRQQQPSGANYFDRYNGLRQSHNLQRRAYSEDEEIPADVDNYLGKGFADVLRLANRIDVDATPVVEDTQILSFSKDFEDPESLYRYEILPQKQVPPRQAYVTLLSLYDALNKESKKLMLNKFAGYKEEVLKDLIEFSKSTSSHQLKSVLSKVVNQGEIKRDDTITKMKTLITDLESENSYLNDALKNIPPLVFSP